MKINLSKIFIKIKLFWKPFLIIFLISFLIINWNSISWIFNYEIISDFFNSAFSKEPQQLENLDEKENKLISNFSTTTMTTIDNKYLENLETRDNKKENSLEILKLGISASLILVEKKSEVQAALKRGVVLFPGSALPGEKGETIILGHSAPSSWPKKNPYYFIFSRISELKEKDEIILNFENKKYRYLVKEKIFLKKGEELPQDLTNSENILVLISCWPPETGTKRIVILAELRII